ncbi:MAG: 50S ribosomal protein L15 [Chloroflexi bacterium]|nr:50S ribosomal protein L15 [Chloroflexota bacterium]
MRLHELAPPKGAHTKRRRIGRGLGSGRGTTAGKGTKGQKARAGGGVAPYFEGGQLPLVRKLPYRRGFTPLARVEYRPINLAALARFAAGSTVDVAALVGAGLLKNDREKAKILGVGEIDRPLTITAHRFSATARQKIEAAGGTCHGLEHAPGAS